MNVKVVDTAMLSRILEYGKSEEMPKVAKGTVIAQNACKQFESVRSLLGKPVDEEINSMLFQVTRHVDILKVLQTLARPRNNGETMAQLAVKCWQQITIDELPTCLKTSLEKHIPTQMLCQLR